MPAVDPPPVSDPEAPGALAASLGARVEPDAYGPQAVFDTASAAEVAAGFVAPLPDLGLLEVSGDEAGKFLHAQLTNDVEHLAPGEARWYGYCSPKGRLLSTSIGWHADAGIALTVAQPLAEPLRKRLSMYVLRTKAKVADRSGDDLLLGVGGAGADAALARLGLAAGAPMTVARHDAITRITLPPVSLAPQGTSGADTIGRCLLRVPRERAAEVWQALASSLRPVSSTVWRWLEVRSAVPRIVADTSERFVPQMINFEVVGGVNFKKGCYPGQEIVARSQYLGKLKRRMYLGHVDGDAPPPGADVRLGGGGEPVGQVVLAAPSPAGGTDLLVELLSSAVGTGLLSVATGTIRTEPLPYALPA